MNSLRDQLLKVGLVTESRRSKRRSRNSNASSVTGLPSPRPAALTQRGRHPGSGQPAARGAAQPGPMQAGAQRPQGQPRVRNTASLQPDARDHVRQTPAPGAATLAAQQAQAAKVARDQELNRRREEKAQRRARLAEIEQIIEQNRLPRLETEDYYSFIDGKKIRRMSVDPERREQLTRGVLMIVRYRGHYAVVPQETADVSASVTQTWSSPRSRPRKAPAPKRRPRILIRTSSSPMT